MKNSHKFRIGVLMGGRSVEREVSFNSGRTVCDHIDIDRYNVIPIFQTVSGKLYILPLKFLHRGKIIDFEGRLATEAQLIAWDDLKQLIDFMYIAVHGRFAEDGTLQGFLEVLGIPYLGSKVFASACGMDKDFQKRLIAMGGIAVPKDILLTPQEIRTLSLKQIKEKLQKADLSYPCVIKPILEGSSLGISVVHNDKELIPALEKASWKDVTLEQNVLIEEKLIGLEFTCIALQANTNSNSSWSPLPITEVIHEKGTEFHDYKQKYMPGLSSKITPARCSEEATKAIYNTCIKVAELLEFKTFFRIDGFLVDNGSGEPKIFIIDPNTLSGMGPASFLFHQAAEVGISHTSLINYLVSCELSNYGLLDGAILQQKKQRGVGVSESAIAKKRVVVLLGGESNEREISLESGRNVCYKLSPSKYDLIPVFVDKQMRLYKLSSRLLVQNSTREIADQLTPELEIKWSDLSEICDFVFIALHGGKGENGSVQGALDMLGLPYNGSDVLASSLCADKYKSNKILARNNIEVPQGFLLAKDAWREHIINICSKLQFPIIIKPHDDGCSTYVSKARSEEELFKILETYFTTEKNFALVEECIIGAELTCGVIGNQIEEVQALPPSLSVAIGGILSIEEKFLPGAGENQTPAPLPERVIALVQDAVKKAYIVLGCRGYARIDCFYQDEYQSPTKKERVVILEINTLPGLTPATCLFHQAAEIGMRPMEFIDKIIEYGTASVMHIGTNTEARKES